MKKMKQIVSAGGSSKLVDSNQILNDNDNQNEIDIQ
jgi:hypothetical protein